MLVYEFSWLKGLVGFNGNTMFFLRRGVESHSTLWLYSIHKRYAVDGCALVGIIEVRGEHIVFLLKES